MIVSLKNKRTVHKAPRNS